MATRRSLRQAQQQGSEVSDALSNELLENDERKLSAAPNSRKRRTPVPKARSDASSSEHEDYQASDEEIAKKKRKTVTRSKNGQKNGNIQVFERLFSVDGSVANEPPCQLPQRNHGVDYHRPLLLDSPKGRADLLEWFDSVSSQRSMPWRKPWIDPRKDAANPTMLRQKLERRAYEVWISEIMLQQTRVAVVIDYWNRWMESWPTIHELAAAGPDDVLAAWRGLGYYSRATRIHDAAKLVCGDSAMKGLLPSNVDELVAKIPGVGRYTAGAISAIVFGKAAPMVDGNVLRVLSRQLGLLGNVKTDKAVIDLLWAAADSLAKAIAEDSGEDKTSGATEEKVSDRPGRWGQALMELGSTVCTPKPDCEVCPIKASCRAYSEGIQLAVTRGLARKDMITSANSSTIPDIEDICGFCAPFEEVGQDDDDKEVVVVPASKKNTKAKRPIVHRQATLSAFFTGPSESKPKAPSAPTELARAGLTAAVEHARKFPVKIIKKAVREQETLVCAVRRSDGRYLIHRRPQKGLLAGLWEFPSWDIPEDYERTAAAEKRATELYVSGVLNPSLRHKSLVHPKLRPIGKLGSVPWLFSHLKLTMHVFSFGLDCSEDESDTLPSADGRWSSTVEEESMGTGMRKCWELVRQANDD